tara:strand:+ start:722 stop:943 length:222 start_codon:yes stop_codon:yes gene_type:complete
MANWLVLTVLTLVVLIAFRMKKPPDEKLDPPSNFVMFFNPIQGEGDLFIGGVFVIYFSSRVFLALFQTLRSIF